MLMFTSLLIMMTPAELAFFYFGLTQSKSVLNSIEMSFVSFCTRIIDGLLLDIVLLSLKETHL